jgi:hypothetical protein
MHRSIVLTPACIVTIHVLVHPSQETYLTLSLDKSFVTRHVERTELLGIRAILQSHDQHGAACCKRLQSVLWLWRDQIWSDAALMM